MIDNIAGHRDNLKCVTVLECWGMCGSFHNKNCILYIQYKGADFIFQPLCFPIR